MQQLTYTGPRTLEWREAAAPALDSDSAALVRPAGSRDVRPRRADRRGRHPRSQPPFPIGHECVAEVIEVGDAVDDTTAPVRS